MALRHSVRLDGLQKGHQHMRPGQDLIEISGDSSESVLEPHSGCFCFCLRVLIRTEIEPGHMAPKPAMWAVQNGPRAVGGMRVAVAKGAGCTTTELSKQYVSVRGPWVSPGALRLVIAPRESLWHAALYARHTHTVSEASSERVCLPGAPGAPSMQMNVLAIYHNALPPNITPSSNPGTLSTSTLYDRWRSIKFPFSRPTNGTITCTLPL